MTLRKPLFASLAILALAVPVTGGALVTFTASPAVAKDGKGKGGSDRGGGSDRSRADRDKGARGSASRGRSGNSGGGFGSGNGNNGGGFGQSRTATPAKAAPMVESETKDGALEMHPSQLGSMNGAMHANIEAVLAHIRNGNTNGPVGALAGLAVADHDAAEAQEVIDSAEDFTALDDALDDAGYADLDEYLTSGETDPAIEEALAALGDTTYEDRPSEEEIAEAQAAIEALPEAEAAVFEAWNKSGSATEGEKAALLDALRDRLEAERSLIDDAVTGTGEDDGEDIGEEGEEDTASLDPETKAIIDGLKF